MHNKENIFCAVVLGTAQIPFRYLSCITDEINVTQRSPRFLPLALDGFQDFILSRAKYYNITHLLKYKFAFFLTPGISFSVGNTVKHILFEIVIAKRGRNYFPTVVITVISLQADARRNRYHHNKP